MTKIGILKGQLWGRHREEPFVAKIRDSKKENTLLSLKVPPIFLSFSLKKAFFNRKMGGTFKEGRVP